MCGEPAASELRASASSDRICSCMRSGQANEAFAGKGRFYVAQDAEAALNSFFAWSLQNQRFIHSLVIHCGGKLHA